MLSRSSSAYQPLGGGSGGEERKNDTDDEAERGHEMTSIAVISQHPFRSSSQTPMISTVTGGPAHGPNPGGELDDFAMCTAAAEAEKGSTPWTNFHFVMCVGIIGFFIFWILLLCRMYLPPEYQLWGSASGSPKSKL